MNGQTEYKYSTYEEHKSQMQYVAVSDGKIAYLDYGEGEALLLVHGVPTSSWLYRHMINPLVNAGYRVIVPDLLGYGASEKPPPFKLYHSKKQGTRLLELMRSLEINRWTQVVHDAGGPWSWEMLLQEHSGVSKLVILNTILYKEGFNPPVKLKPGSCLSGLITEFYGSHFGSRMMAKSTLGSGTKKAKLNREERLGYSSPLRNGANRAVGYFLTHLDYFDHLLPQIQALLETKDIPILVIWGAKDTILQSRIQIPLIKEKLQVPEGNIHILEESDHFVQEEEPKRVINLIIASKAE